MIRNKQLISENKKIKMRRMEGRGPWSLEDDVTPAPRSTTANTHKRNWPEGFTKKRKVKAKAGDAGEKEGGKRKGKNRENIKEEGRSGSKRSGGGEERGEIGSKGGTKENKGRNSISKQNSPSKTQRGVHTHTDLAYENKEHTVFTTYEKRLVKHTNNLNEWEWSKANKPSFVASGRHFLWQGN